MTEYVAITSDQPNAKTVSVMDSVRGCGFLPILISRESNQARLAELGFSPEESILLQELNEPSQAFDELESSIRKKDIRFANWINVPDSLTNTFLYCVELLDIDFRFRKAYTQSRLKPHARKLASEQGLSTIKFDLYDLSASPQPTIHKPFISKPISGTGSQGVTLVNGSNDWRHAVADATQRRYHTDICINGFWPGRQLLLEEFIPGHEFEIDGFSYDGTPTFCAVGFKVHQFRDIGVREIGGVTYRPFSIENLREFDIRLTKWAERLLSVLDFCAGTFHIEGKVSDGRIELIELNPRPGGGGVQPIVKRLSGVDLLEQCVRLWVDSKPSCGLIETSDCSILYYIVYPEATGILASIAPCATYDLGVITGCGVSPLHGEWTPFAKVGDRLFPALKEQYLGEVHISNVMPPLDSLGAILKTLGERVVSKGLIQEQESESD